MKRSAIALATLGVIAGLLLMPYLSLGNPHPLSPEGRFARMAGFPIPESLGRHVFDEAHMKGPRQVIVEYSGGAELSVAAGGSEEYYERWDPEAAIADEERRRHLGPHRSGVVEVRGVEAAVIEFLPAPGGRVALTWVEGSAVLRLELPETTLEDAVALCEGL